MSRFLNGLEKQSNYTLTENEAVALKSTESALVDAFGRIGALRKAEDSDIEAIFSKAFAEDPLLATKMAFYARDIRGGLGERRVFRIILNYLATIRPEIVDKNIHFIPHFGRWDDLYALINTPVEDRMWEFVFSQLKADLYKYHRVEEVSLLAKWLKSVDASSKETRKLGKLTAKKLGLTEKQYRKTLSKLRNHIDVVERKMSKNQWENIVYPSVPSRAMSIYRKAFARQDPVRFIKFIQDVKAGKSEIKSGTLYPYDILEKMELDFDSFALNTEYFHACNYDEVLEEQWKALPNYITEENNVLIMADTSASMIGRPLYTSIGLAIYFAERNKGPFHNKFVTFSAEPSFIKLQGDTLYDKVKCIPHIVSNTNLEKAFNLILDTAIVNELAQEEMPKALIVISDMEFDRQTMDSDMTWHEAMEKKFEKSGYNLPNIIYWNVDSRHETFHAVSDRRGVQLASGQSPSIFQMVINNIDKTPYEAMVEILNSPRYECITI